MADLPDLTRLAETYATATTEADKHKVAEEIMTAVARPFSYADYVLYWTPVNKETVAILVEAVEGEVWPDD